MMMTTTTMMMMMATTTTMMMMMVMMINNVLLLTSYLPQLNNLTGSYEDDDDRVYEDWDSKTETSKLATARGENDD